MGKKYRLHDFVVMPNHVHLLVTPLEGMLRGEFRDGDRITADAVDGKIAFRA